MNVPVLVLALIVQQPQDTVVLKPVVVTATRVPVAADLIASAITVLRGSDLVAQGIRTVADALQAVPGAHVVETGSYGGADAPVLPGGGGEYVEGVVDRGPLNPARGGSQLPDLTTD